MSVNMFWQSLDYLNGLLEKIWLFATYEERARLTDLQIKAENGSNEIKKILYDEIQRIQDVQEQALSNNSNNRMLVRASEAQEAKSLRNDYNAYQNQQLALCQNPQQQHHAATYGCSTQPSAYSRSHQAPSSRSYNKVDKVHKSAYAIQDQLYAELSKPSQGNSLMHQYPIVYKPPPPPPILGPKYLKSINQEQTELEEIRKKEKFIQDQEAWRQESERKRIQEENQFQERLRQKEFEFQKSLTVQRNYNALPSTYEDPKPYYDAPKLSTNLAKFADDLSKITKKYQAPTSPIDFDKKLINNETTKLKTTRSKSSPRIIEKPYSSVNHRRLSPELNPTSAMEVDVKPANEKNYQKSEINVLQKNSKINIGVMGLNKSGKSRLISSLANVSPQLLEKTKSIEFDKNGAFFEIHHQNYGISNPESIKATIQQFFEKINLNNLSCLLNVVSGDLREEDIFACQLALQMGVQVAIIRTKSDEWLDGSYPNNVTPKNKQNFAEKDKKYIRDIARGVNEAVAKCLVFNVSAFAIDSILKKSKRAEIMQKYLIDEMALIEYLESFGLSFECLKNVLNQTKNNERTNESVQVTKISNDNIKNLPSAANNEKTVVNILFVGRVGAGKSAIIDALRGIKPNDENSATKNNFCTIQNTQIAEFGYQQPSSNFLDGLNQYDLTQLKQIYLVVGDAVGEIDVKVAKYFISNGLNLTVLLNKTDTHIDNATERQGFDSDFLLHYFNQRLAAAKQEFSRLIATPIQTYVISSLVIRNKNKFAKYTCDEDKFLNDFSTNIF